MDMELQVLGEKEKCTSKLGALAMPVLETKDGVRAGFTVPSFEACFAGKLKACFRRLRHGIVLLECGSILHGAFRKCFLNTKHNFPEAFEPVTGFLIIYLCW